MKITVNVKCPDLALAASALAKAILSANTPAMLTPQVDLDPSEVKAAMQSAPVQIMPGTYPTPAPVAAPTQTTAAPQAPTSAATAPSPAVSVTAGPGGSANPIPGAPQSSTPAAAMTAPAQIPTAPSQTAVPTTPAPGITGDMVAKAGADLIAANPQAMGPLNALLQKYGVGCAQDLRPDQIGPFATEMRGLGAKI